MKEKNVKFRVGRYRIPVTLIYKDNRIYVRFKYHKGIINEVKSMEGAKWHGYEEPPRKIWSIKNSLRNLFQLDYLMEKNPYAHYDKPIIDLGFTERCDKKIYQVQKDMSNFFATRHYCIAACEMGVGKTLSVFLVAEWAIANGMINESDIWYIGPRSGVRAVNLEIRKWNFKFRPRMLTYSGLVKVIREWEPDTSAPKFVIFDESSKIKNGNAQRSQASKHLADAVRLEYKENGFVILMSGTPSPKSPVDWYSQAETACPGFIREGQVNKFKKNLCIIVERESISGGIFPYLVTYLDDENKCKICGQFKEHENHLTGNSAFEKAAGLDVDNKHRFQKSINEVDRLYKRMKGLVLVRFKKDCLDLPEKQYIEVKIPPTPEILRAAKIIATKSTRAITAHMLLRELSDGFNYIEIETGTKSCKECHGTGKVKILIPDEEPNLLEPVKLDFTEEKEVLCDNCGGIGTVKTYSRTPKFVDCPKDEYLVQDLEDAEGIGRFVVWGGFTATVDRLVEIAHKYDWATLRVDGRGYVGETSDGEALDDNELLEAMDRSHPKAKLYLERYPKLCFVGQPEAGGMALTLTATPIEVFYSNTFKGEARMQAEDRCHRLGMDKNKGLIVKDYLMLPSDKLVLDNLKKKKDLQAMSMGALQEAFNGK
jgi:hypothetical protein